MFCPNCQIPMWRLRGVLSRMLALAILLALGACDGANDPLAPASADDAPVPASQPAVPEYVMTAGTLQRIVFVSYRNGNQPDIYKMDPQGTSIAPLTPNSAATDAAPAWSYDNKRIAMRRLRQSASGSITDIYVINADGGNGHWVRPTPYPFHLTDPSWSPDGSRIVLSVWLQGGWYLASMNVASGQVSLILPATGYIQGRYPSYDRTGQRIIYVSNDLKTIRQINADGTGQKVRFSSATWLANPTFSPDGKRIAFDQIVGTGSNYDIFVKNLVDGLVKRLTFTAQWDDHPSWSPDGARIAFASRRSGKSQIYTMSANGGTATRITQTTVNEFSPAWSH